MPCFSIKSAKSPAVALNPELNIGLAEVAFGQCECNIVLHVFFPFVCLFVLRLSVFIVRNPGGKVEPRFLVHEWSCYAPWQSFASRLFQSFRRGKPAMCRDARSRFCLVTPVVKDKLRLLFTAYEISAEAFRAARNCERFALLATGQIKQRLSPAPTAESRGRFLDL